MARKCTACGRAEEEHGPGITFHPFTTERDADGARKASDLKERVSRPAPSSSSGEGADGEDTEDDEETED